MDGWMEGEIDTKYLYRKSQQRISTHVGTCVDVRIDNELTSGQRGAQEKGHDKQKGAESLAVRGNPERQYVADRSGTRTRGTLVAGLYISATTPSR